MSQHTSGRNGFNRSVGRHLLWAAGAAAMGWAQVASGQVAGPAGSPPQPAGAVAPASPAVDEIQADLDQKQYGAAIRAATKLLAVRGGPGAGFSRFQVTMLKGDAQAGAHALPAARASYRDALRETHDPQELALASWTLELFRRARGNVYVPHVAGPAAVGNNGPIDLTDPQNRKAAFAALLEDQLSALGPALKQASGAGSLPQILPVVKQVQSLTELDEIANGSDARTAATAGQLLDHARNLMSNALKGMWTRISDISASATQQVTTGVPTGFINGQPVQQTTTSENGLTSNDANELRAMIDTCNKIRDAAGVFMPLAHGGNDKDWGAILNDATRVAGRASDVLNGNYGSVSTTTAYPGDAAATTLVAPNGYNNTYYPPGTNGNYSGTYPGGTGYVGGTNPVPTGPATSGGNSPSTGTTAGGTSSSTPTSPTTPSAPTNPVAAPTPQPNTPQPPSEHPHQLPPNERPHAQ